MAIGTRRLPCGRLCCLLCGAARELLDSFLRRLLDDLRMKSRLPGGFQSCELGRNVLFVRFFLRPDSFGLALRFGCLTRPQPLVFKCLFNALANLLASLGPRCGEVAVFSAVQICPGI